MAWEICQRETGRRTIEAQNYARQSALHMRVLGTSSEENRDFILVSGEERSLRADSEVDITPAVAVSRLQSLYVAMVSQAHNLSQGGGQDSRSSLSYHKAHSPNCQHEQWYIYPSHDR